jgi:hypothetical protein
MDELKTHLITENDSRKNQTSRVKFSGEENEKKIQLLKGYYFIFFFIFYIFLLKYSFIIDAVKRKFEIPNKSWSSIWISVKTSINAIGKRYGVGRGSSRIGTSNQEPTINRAIGEDNGEENEEIKKILNQRFTYGRSSSEEDNN